MCAHLCASNAQESAVKQIFVAPSGCSSNSNVGCSFERHLRACGTQNNAERPFRALWNHQARPERQFRVLLVASGQARASISSALAAPRQARTAFSSALTAPEQARAAISSALASPSGYFKCPLTPVQLIPIFWSETASTKTPKTWKAPQARPGH